MIAWTKRTERVNVIAVRRAGWQGADVHFLGTRWGGTVADAALPIPVPLAQSRQSGPCFRQALVAGSKRLTGTLGEDLLAF